MELQEDIMAENKMEFRVAFVSPIQFILIALILVFMEWQLVHIRRDSYTATAILKEGICEEAE